MFHFVNFISKFNWYVWILNWKHILRENDHRVVSEKYACFVYLSRAKDEQDRTFGPNKNTIPIISTNLGSTLHQIYGHKNTVSYSFRRLSSGPAANLKWSTYLLKWRRDIPKGRCICEFRAQPNWWWRLMEPFTWLVWLESRSCPKCVIYQSISITFSGRQRAVSKCGSVSLRWFKLAKWINNHL